MEKANLILPSAASASCRSAVSASCRSAAPAKAAVKALRFRANERLSVSASFYRLKLGY
jgi:hypothetical protein